MSEETIKLVNTESIGSSNSSISEDIEERALDNIREDVQNILTEFGDDSCLYCTLYKTFPGKSGRTQVDRFEGGTIPDSHSLGVKHGGGIYWVYINYKDPNTKSGRNSKRVKFELSEYYDELKRENDVKKATDPMYRLKHGFGENRNSGVDVSSMIGMMMQMQQSQQQMMMQMQQNSQANMLGLVTALAPVLGNLLKPQEPRDSLAEKLLPTLITANNDSANKHFESMTEAFNNGLRQGEKMNNEDDKNWLDLAEQIIQNADKILDPIFGAIARKKVQNAPEIKGILADKSKFNHVKQGLIAKHGQEKTAQILNAVGVKHDVAVETPALPVSPVKNEVPAGTIQL